MAGFKLLIDTNVVIGLEDARPVSESFAEIVRLSNEHKVDLFVDSANYDDVSRDRDAARRAITQSKLAKFQRLRVIPATSEAALVARFITRPTGVIGVRKRANANRLVSEQLSRVVSH
jgi:hypothetical protein